MKLDARFDAFGRFAGDLPNRVMKLRRVHAAEGFAEVLLRRIGLENLIPGGKRDVRAGDDVFTDFVNAGTDADSTGCGYAGCREWRRLGGRW